MGYRGYRGDNGTYFAYQDANWNVIGLTTPGGDLAEEYNYTPYGRQLAWRYTTNGDSDADGDVDDTDDTAYAAAAGTEKGDEEYDRTFDADYDGDVDTFDQYAFRANYTAAGESMVVTNRAWSANENPYGYTCRRLDTESLLMHYRARTYNPGLKVFMQRDPLEYVDGPDLYEYVSGSPLDFRDPEGLWCGSDTAGGLGADKWVPDKPLWAANFSEPCRIHDECYATLGNAKAFCDLQFLDNMLEVCASQPFGTRSICRSLAMIYFRAVSETEGAEEAYAEGQREAQRKKEADDRRKAEKEKRELERRRNRPKPQPRKPSKSKRPEHKSSMTALLGLKIGEGV